MPEASLARPLSFTMTLRVHHFGQFGSPGWHFGPPSRCSAGLGGSGLGPVAGPGDRGRSISVRGLSAFGSGSVCL